jgi:hypothetical protein
MAEHPPFRTAGALTVPGIAHGFFGREGGVSGGLYASLNCGLGSQDARDNALENRRRGASALGAQALNTAYQCHSADVLVVTGPWTSAPPRGDAMVTRVPGIALGVLAADCAPVLFADAQARIIGAAHAGWRGALDGVLEATVRAMESQGAQRQRVVAGLGPCIGAPSYEVGADFEARFRATSEAYADFFLPAGRGGHFFFDLPGFVASRLLACGLAATETVACDTYAEEGRYFSYRRATHCNEEDYGRNLSAIVLRP